MALENEQAAAAKVPTARDEWIDAWRRMPRKALFVTLLAAWLVLFQWLGNSTLGYANTPSLFGWWLWMETRGITDGQGWVILQAINSEEAHAWIIPFVVLGLLWWKRSELLALPKAVWWPALVGLAFALAAHIFGFMIQQTRVSVFAFFAGIYALTGLAWGWPWMRAVFFPFALFIFCVPLGPGMD